MTRVEWVAAFAVLVCLMVLLVVSSRRWGPPRSFVSLRAAAWFAALVMVLVMLRLVTDN